MILDRHGAYATERHMMIVALLGSKTSVTAGISTALQDMVSIVQVQRSDGRAGAGVRCQ